MPRKTTVTLSIFEHDVAIITAKKGHGNDNRAIRSVLIGLRYGIATIGGNFILVVNLHNVPDFKENIISLGNRYDRDTAVERAPIAFESMETLDSNMGRLATHVSACNFLKGIKGKSL